LGKNKIMKHEAKTPFGRRAYELQESVITAKGDIPLRGNFEVTLDLPELDPRYERLWLRSQFLTVGMWFFAVGMIAYLIETAFIGMDGWSEACLFTLMWAFIGVFLMIVSLKKYQILRFKTKSGVPVLDVFEDGPMKASFTEFVDELVKRISACPLPK
jgi:hypothetical protein